MPVHAVNLEERATHESSSGVYRSWRERRGYYDLLRREVISRRQYLKRHGIFPMSRREDALGRVRSDKGCTRQSIYRGTSRRQPFVQEVVLPDGIRATIHPVGGLLYRLMIRYQRVAPLRVELRGERRRWHCEVPGCGYHESNQKKIAFHCYQIHYRDPVQTVGKLPEKVWYTGEVRTNERRARMPWIAPAQSSRPFFGKG